MRESLEAQNRALRAQLDELLRQARANEEKLRRLQRLEHRLIGARSLAELLHLLLGEYPSVFELAGASIWLVDRDGLLKQLLDEAEPSEQGLGQRDVLLSRIKLLESADELPLASAEAWAPRLGAATEALSHCLFAGHAGSTLRSMAQIPLMRRGECIGQLNFASADASRYEADAGTEFLSRLGAVIAVCLDSVLNQERLKQAGITDGLTGVHNRRYFEHRCQIEVSQAKRYKHGLACMFLDVDHFKRINDSFGHQAGDEVLRQVGQRIRSQLRTGDTIARYGGEEFVVLLPRCADSHALETAERIRSALCAKLFPLQDGQNVEVTISVGLSMLSSLVPSSQAAQLAQSLVAAADAAVYRAKALGRNRVAVG